MDMNRALDIREKNGQSENLRKVFDRPLDISIHELIERFFLGTSR